MRKTKTLLGTLLFIAIGLGGCQASSATEDQVDEVRIGYQLIPNGNPIVKKQRWLEQNLNAEVVWIQFPSGSDVNRAFQADEIDIGLIGSNPTAVGLSAGIDYSVVWIHNLLGSNEGLVVRETLGVTSVGDLEGLTLATPFASTAHYSLMAALEQNGLSAESVSLIDMQPQDIRSAWVRGDLDGAYVWNPTLLELRTTGGDVVVDSSDLAAAGFPTADLGVVSNDFLASHPQIVSEWIVQQDRAIRFIREFPDEAAELVALDFGITEADAKRQLLEVDMLDASQQLSSGYFPSPEGPGILVGMLASTTQFLANEGVISESLSVETISANITADFIGR